MCHPALAFAPSYLASQLLVAPSGLHQILPRPPEGRGRGEGETRSGQNVTAGQTTVQGCWQESNGSYTLTSDSGMTYLLQGASSTLSKHVGHVGITGSTSSAGSSRSETDSAAGASEKDTHRSTFLRPAATQLSVGHRPPFGALTRNRYRPGSSEAALAIDALNESDRKSARISEIVRSLNTANCVLFEQAPLETMFLKNT
jgi:hypothetical protein